MPKQGVFVITVGVHQDNNFDIMVKGLSRYGDIDKSNNYDGGLFEREQYLKYDN